MELLIATIAGVGLWAIAATIRAVRSDGYRRLPTCPR